jgi:predicted nucleotidyltransferase
MHADVSEKRNALAAICRRYGVARLEVFGSAARADDFDPARSDADFLVTFNPSVRNDLGAFSDLKEALEKLLGRPVDLVEREAGLWLNCLSATWGFSICCWIEFV